MLISTLLEKSSLRKTNKKLICRIYFYLQVTSKCYAGLRFPSIQTLTGILNTIESDNVKGTFRIAGKILPTQASGYSLLMCICNCGLKHSYWRLSENVPFQRKSSSKHSVLLIAQIIS